MIGTTISTDAGGDPAPPGSDDDRLLSIGQLAEQAGVSSRTIRYYEQRGILPQPPRSSGGTRRYPPQYRFYLDGALALKELGFSLDEIQLLGRLALGQDLSAHERAETSTIVNSNMERLERRIRILERLHEVMANEGHDGQRFDGERLSSLTAILREEGDADEGSAVGQARRG